MQRIEQNEQRCAVYTRAVGKILLPERHSFHLFAEHSPVVGLQLSIFDPLLTPVYVQLADMIL